jgi:hypothetical protein
VGTEHDQRDDKTPSGFDDSLDKALKAMWRGHSRPFDRLVGEVMPGEFSLGKALLDAWRAAPGSTTRPANTTESSLPSKTDETIPCKDTDPGDAESAPQT